MKNIFSKTILFAVSVMSLTSCDSDQDSNPTLIQPTEFVLNTPAYINEVIDLGKSETLPLSWSQPNYTADNAPIVTTYSIQISPTGTFDKAYDVNLEDNTGADYITLDETTTVCKATLPVSAVAKAIQQFYGWEDETQVPKTLELNIRLRAAVKDAGMVDHNEMFSNVLQLTVAPCYMMLKDADPIMFYLVGNSIGDGAWGNKPGESSFPMFLQGEYNYDKKTGAGEITYLNYFDSEGWKMQPADFNWDMGFMGTGKACEAVFRNGGDDKGNIWMDEAGYYLVTVNTGTNECKIEKQDITPAVYDKICITGDFNGWKDTDMVPVKNNGENHVWCHTMTVDKGAVSPIKFKIAGSWDTNWGFGENDGDINTCGKGTNGGKNIGVGEGTWIIMFNDITGEFSIIEKK